MATITNGWIFFAGNYSCRVVDISHVYVAGALCRICLKSGMDFHVPESYADVMRAIAAAS